MNDLENPLDLQVRKVLIPLLSKIEIGAISPSHKLSDTHTQKIVRKAETLRYEQGLMTPEEESAYERDVLGFTHTEQQLTQSTGE
jgi:predicted phosphoribosyltransferase